MSELELTVEALKQCVSPEEFERAMKRISRRERLGGAAWEGNAENREQKIREILLEVGVPAAIRGYRYAATAIGLLLEEPELAEAITKELYPRVAMIHNSTYSRVERAIRHGIEVAWERGDMDVHYRFFRNSVSGEKGKPTNSEFLTRIADLVRDRMGM